MNGPERKPKIGPGIGLLEIGTTIAGLTVVIGLLMESGSEISRTWINHFWPSKALWGDVLVTIGVFAEVAVGIFIARSSKREQIEADERIGKAWDQAAKARLAALQADIKRDELEVRLRDRRARRDQTDALIPILSNFVGRRFRVHVVQSSEALRFWADLRNAFDVLNPLVQEFDPNEGPPGVIIWSSRQGDELAIAIRDALFDTGILPYRPALGCMHGDDEIVSLVIQSK